MQADLELPDFQHIMDIYSFLEISRTLYFSFVFPIIFVLLFVLVGRLRNFKSNYKAKNLSYIRRIYIVFFIVFFLLSVADFYFIGLLILRQLNQNAFLQIFNFVVSFYFALIACDNRKFTTLDELTPDIVSFRESESSHVMEDSVNMKINTQENKHSREEIIEARAKLRSNLSTLRFQIKELNKEVDNLPYRSLLAWIFICGTGLLVCGYLMVFPYLPIGENYNIPDIVRSLSGCLFAFLLCALYVNFRKFLYINRFISVVHETCEENRKIHQYWRLFLEDISSLR